MGRKGNLEGILVQKEDQIAVLESRIQAYNGRLSLLQSRLLATLDTLDVIQTSHAQEMSAAAQTQNRLRAQLDEYMKIVKAAEFERDDMRDAVVQLIEKVEASNDCSQWPYSKMHLSSLHDPVPLPPKDDKQRKDEETLTYATALIDRLRHERDAARKSLSQMQEQAETRIVALEAKLSRREAEIEALISSTEAQPSSDVERTPRVLPKVSFEQGEIANEQITALLDETVARNKRLESEITVLYRRLEKARSAKSGNMSKSFSSPTSNGLPQTASYLDSDDPFTAPSLSAVDNTRAESKAIIVEPPQVNHEVLRSLENQIKLLGNKIDAFTQERNTLFESISSRNEEEERRVVSDYLSDVSIDDAGRRNRSYDDDDQELTVRRSHHHVNDQVVEQCMHCLRDGCASLQATADLLRAELAATAAAAQVRENALLDALQELRGTVAAGTTFHGSTYRGSSRDRKDIIDQGMISRPSGSNDRSQRLSPQAHQKGSLIFDVQQRGAENVEGEQQNQVHYQNSQPTDPSPHFDIAPIASVTGNTDPGDGQAGYQQDVPCGEKQFDHQGGHYGPHQVDHGRHIQQRRDSHSPSSSPHFRGDGDLPESRGGEQHSDPRETGTKSRDGTDDGEISMELATPLIPLRDMSPSPSANDRVGSPPIQERDISADEIQDYLGGYDMEGGSEGHLQEAEYADGSGRGQHDGYTRQVSNVRDDEYDEYVDPPSIPLPPTPDDEIADLSIDNEREEDEVAGHLVDADSPTLSHMPPFPALLDPHGYGFGSPGGHSRLMYHATSSFVAELRHVESEITLSQIRLDEGVNALRRVEEIVAELQPPDQ